MRDSTFSLPATMYCTVREKSCARPGAGEQTSVSGPSVTSGAKDVLDRLLSSTPDTVMVLALLSMMPS